MASQPGSKTALVTGAGGLLGRALAGALAARGWRAHGLDRTALDVTDPAAVRNAVGSLEPAAVFHCAAYTAVDRAESEPDEAFRVNREGAAHVASACARSGATLVYPSTDYVFAGDRTRPYRPDDPTGPLNVYGASKLAGEGQVRDAGCRYVIARTSWLFGDGEGSFVDRMLALAGTRDHLRVVDDQTSRPTWSVALAEALVDLVERQAEGTFHVACGGTATWYDLASESLRLAGSATPVHPVDSDTWGAPAARPPYSVLDISATEALLGRAMPSWQAALRSHLERGGHLAESLEGTLP